MQDSSEWSNLGLAAIGCPVYTGAQCVVSDRLHNHLKKKKATANTQMKALYVPWGALGREGRSPPEAPRLARWAFLHSLEFSESPWGEFLLRLCDPGCDPHFPLIWCFFHSVSRDWGEGMLLPNHTPHPYLQERTCNPEPGCCTRCFPLPWEYPDLGQCLGNPQVKSWDFPGTPPDSGVLVPSVSSENSSHSGTWLCSILN